MKLVQYFLTGVCTAGTILACTLIMTSFSGCNSESDIQRMTSGLLAETKYKGIIECERETHNCQADCVKTYIEGEELKLLACVKGCENTYNACLPSEGSYMPEIVACLEEDTEKEEVDLGKQENKDIGSQDSTTNNDSSNDSSINGGYEPPHDEDADYEGGNGGNYTEDHNNNNGDEDEEQSGSSGPGDSATSGSNAGGTESSSEHDDGEHSEDNDSNGSGTNDSNGDGIDDWDWEEDTSSLEDPYDKNGSKGASDPSDKNTTGETSEGPVWVEADFMDDCSIDYSTCIEACEEEVVEGCKSYQECSLDVETCYDSCHNTFRDCMKDGAEELDFDPI
jgi:hypothetical protein